MKIKNLFVLSLAALSFVACSNEDESIAPQEGSLVVDLSSVAAVSKATETGIGSESHLNTVIVYAFNSDGALYSEPRTISAGNASQTSLTWQLPVGSYTIAAVSGLSQLSSVTASTLPSQVVALTDNTREKFVMYGATNVTISAGETASAQIDVARVLAGVKLVDIKTQFAESVPEIYKNAVKTLASIKIVGSKANALLSGAANASAAATDDDNMTKAVFADANAITITNDGDVDVSNLTTAARAYACPGEITRITIGVNYSGVGTRYYSVGSQTLQFNTMYGLDITITGIGSEDPDTPTPVGNGNYTIKAQDWSTGTVISGDIEY
ncbi:FimB/Mfa2 family fimbrial subunit [Parabacteroides goldsteinii]|uniref:FimB/Mfa2 family fimbrial subunit n=1 Tax=Parabacteroides goldsteinii TaxID=328812 RepID=UPI0032C07AF8